MIDNTYFDTPFDNSLSNNLNNNISDNLKDNTDNHTLKFNLPNSVNSVNTAANNELVSYNISNNNEPDYGEHQIVTLINQILVIGINKRASDIHFEPYQHNYRVRTRIDGVLNTIKQVPLEQAKQITARLKIMAKLNIAEQRLPQDGQLIWHDKAIRIATLPVLYGEKVVLRIMGNQSHSLLLSQLGLTPDKLNCYQQSLSSPQGLILVTGPTGSGKTMTLYSGLNTINQDDRNICSIEDPVEMPITGINQTQINTKIGLSFAKTLRAFLRQDPDVIMIGEIRDQQTAEIAIQAAQTGHLVLSTLHTNSTIQALIRLNQMGIANYLLAASIKLIIAQRLLRKLCSSCKILAPQPIYISTSEHQVIDQHYIANGCTDCVGGYRDRIGVYEFLPMTLALQKQLLISSTISVANLQDLFFTQGGKTLKQEAFMLIKQGITSYTEVQRVLDASQE